MKKQILNLGKGLSKAEQKLINGGSEDESSHWVQCNDNHEFDVANCDGAADSACDQHQGWTVCAG